MPEANVVIAPVPLRNVEVPFTFTCTIGMFVPMSSLSVTPIRAAMTVVFAVMAMFATPARACNGLADATVSVCMPLKALSSRRS